MQKVLHQKAIVQPGGKVVLSSSELEAGQTVDVVVLYAEPHARGLGCDQHADAPDIDDATRQRFTELADQWEKETVFLSSMRRIAAHPAHQEIVSMGEPAVPLILERMRAQGGYWFYALRDITGANPIQPADRGKVSAMQEAWLEWGEANGYA